MTKKYHIGEYCQVIGSVIGVRAKTLLAMKHCRIEQQKMTSRAYVCRLKKNPIKNSENQIYFSSVMLS